MLKQKNYKSNIENIVKGIAKSTKRLQKMMQSNLPAINSEINDIIKNKSRDIKRIENILDTLSDYAYLNVGKSEFSRLNAYYASFNKKNSKWYASSYTELLK